MRKGVSVPLKTDRFSGILLNIPGGDEGDIWLDFSRQFCPAGVLSPGAENADVFLITDDGLVQKKFARSVMKSAEKYEASLQIGTSGEAEFSLTAMFTGRNSLIEKYATDERYSDELIGNIAEIFHHRAVVADAAFTDGSMYGEKGISVRGTIPGFALTGSRTLSFKPFFNPTELPDFLGAETRLSPLVIGEEILKDERSRILLPAGYEDEIFSFDKIAVFSRGSVRYSVKKDKGSSTVVVERSVHFPECEIEPENYGDFLTFCSELRAVEQMRVTFTKGR
jgi:hypothetical protein